MPLTKDDIDQIASALHERIKADPPLLSKMLGDIKQLSHVVGRWSSAERFIQYKCLAGAYQASNAHELLRHSAKLASTNGMLLEFGVARGATINILSQEIPDRRWYGFDSFDGLPEDWFWLHPKGAFSQQGVLPQVNKNVELVKGLFEETLPLFIKQHSEELARNGIAMLHIDCDLYSSAKVIFNVLHPYLRTGTVIQFDEYWFYADWVNHEAKVFDEFLKSSTLSFTPIGYVPHSAQLAVSLV
jgi:Methyltransferase domain